MGYRISYENGWERKRICERGTSASPNYLVSVIVILFVITALLCFNNAEIRQMLLPGNGAMTEEAIRNFIYSIKTGSELGDAIRVFCQEIIQSAR